MINSASVKKTRNSYCNRWRLCVLVSQDMCPSHNWLSVVQSVIRTKGNTVDCIQLREKHLNDKELLERTKQLIALCRPKGVNVVINDRPDIAMLAATDGVHLGQDDLPCAEVRKMVGNKLIIGVSTSSLNQAKNALRDGADYCGVGPMFPTTTKPKDKIPGITYLRQYLAWNRLPYLAIGGITTDNITQVIEAGGNGVAVSRQICSSSDPATTVRQLTRIIPNEDSLKTR